MDDGIIGTGAGRVGLGKPGGAAVDGTEAVSDSWTSDAGAVDGGVDAASAISVPVSDDSAPRDAALDDAPRCSSSDFMCPNGATSSHL